MWPAHDSVPDAGMRVTVTWLVTRWPSAQCLVLPQDDLGAALLLSLKTGMLRASWTWTTTMAGFPMAKPGQGWVNTPSTTVDPLHIVLHEPIRRMRTPLSRLEQCKCNHDSHTTLKPPDPYSCWAHNPSNESNCNVSTANQQHYTMQQYKGRPHEKCTVDCLAHTPPSNRTPTTHDKSSLRTSCILKATQSNKP